MEDLYFIMKFVWHKLTKHYAVLTPTTGILLISEHILDLFQKLGSLQKWGKGMDINSVAETFYTTQYHEVFL
jgi:hypothetical protein